jgi:hypothetical protein
MMKIGNKSPVSMDVTMTEIGHTMKEFAHDTSSINTDESMMMLVDDDDDIGKLSSSWSSLPLSLSQPTETPVTIDPDSMDSILSFLTLSDYLNLSMVSKGMNDSVSTSSHLFMLTACSNTIIRRGPYQFRRRHDDNDNSSKHNYLICHTPEELAIENSLVFSSGFRTASLSSSSSSDSQQQHDLVTLLNRFQNLRVVSLCGPVLSMVSDTLIGILNGCPASNTLQSITLHGCDLSYWCTQSLQIPNLQHLTFTGGTSIRSRISFLLKDSKQLKTVTLKDCPSIRDEDIYELSKIVQNTLEELTLHHLKLLRPRRVRVRRLNRLSLVGCFSLTDLSKIHCPTLTELNLSFCVRLTGEQIQCMIDRLPSLTTLIMMNCSGVRTLELNSNTLRVLNVSYSHSLQRLRLVCPLLEQLEVSFDNQTRSVMIM